MNEESKRHAEFAACAQRHRGILLRIASGFAWGADRDDLLQDMLLALWHALPHFEGRAAESTFVYRVALNTALADRRRVMPTTESAEIDELADTATEPPEALIGIERDAALSSAIAKLPAIDRSLVLLHLDGLSYREIGEVIGLAESNVGARLSRARRRLATLVHGDPS